MGCVGNTYGVFACVYGGGYGVVCVSVCMELCVVCRVCLCVCVYGAMVWYVFVWRRVWGGVCVYGTMCGV